MVKIEFLKNGEYLGVYYIHEMSDEKDRDALAKNNDIEYDEFILDDGRSHCRLASSTGNYSDHLGRKWLIL